MTAQEFEREFDILYNNIMSNAAPSIDAYEKSVFLTKAQEEVVVALYEGTFEGSERLIECLDKLVVTKEFDSDECKKDLDESIKPLASNSIFFEQPDNLLFITYEALKLKDKDACGNDVIVLVKPTKQDEYYRISKNPFRRPRRREALRLNTNDLLEVISTYTDYYYIVRYVRKPKPIILYEDNELTVNGLNTYDSKNPCELDPMIHRAILDAAVALAVNTYKQTTNS